MLNRWKHYITLTLASCFGYAIANGTIQPVANVSILTYPAKGDQEITVKQFSVIVASINKSQITNASAATTLAVYNDKAPPLTVIVKKNGGSNGDRCWSTVLKNAGYSKTIIPMINIPQVASVNSALTSGCDTTHCPQANALANNIKDCLNNSEFSAANQIYIDYETASGNYNIPVNGAAAGFYHRLNQATGKNLWVYLNPSSLSHLQSNTSLINQPYFTANLAAYSVGNARLIVNSPLVQTGALKFRVTLNTTLPTNTMHDIICTLQGHSSENDKPATKPDIRTLGARFQGVDIYRITDGADGSINSATATLVENFIQGKSINDCKVNTTGT